MFFKLVSGMKRATLFTVLFLTGFFTLLAQGPPIFTDTPLMLGLEGRGIRTFGNVISKENGSAYIHPIAIPYNITRKWQVGVIVPYVSINPKELPTQSGIGDIKLFAKYQIYQKDEKRKTLRSLVKLIETFPTGNSTEIPKLGTGAYQTMISLVSAYVTTKYGLYSEFGYNVVGNNLPDHFIYNIAFGYPLLPQSYPPKQLNLFLEMNGYYVIDDIGNNLFISPGIQYIAGRKVLFESGIQIPLDQAAPDGQKTNYILRIGTRVLIF